MATTTASLSLTSSDLFADNLSISTSHQLNKAGTTIGLDQTTGLNRVYLTATTNVDIFTVPGATKDGKKSHVYIANLSADETEYITVSIGDKVIGRLYAGDWALIPWSAHDADNDIKIDPSANDMTLEYMLFTDE